MITGTVSIHGSKRTATLRATFGVFAGILTAIIVSGGPKSTTVVQAAPPPGTKYVGLTKCAACHFSQYQNWKSSPHGRAFEILPTKYRNKDSCLKCHSTGFGMPTTVRDVPAFQLTGVSCEACHGPGGEHSKNALKFVDETITEAGLKVLRDSILKINPDSTCVNCHITKAHRMHPPFDRDVTSTARTSRLPGLPSRGLTTFHSAGDKR